MIAHRQKIVRSHSGAGLRYWFDRGYGVRTAATARRNERASFRQPAGRVRSVHMLVLASLMTDFQRSLSLGMNAPASGGAPTGSQARSASACLIRGYCSALANSPLNHLARAGGVLGGATTATQDEVTNPGNVCAIVGTPGIDGSGFSDATASALTWPLRIGSSELPRLSNKTSTRPSLRPRKAATEPGSDTRPTRAQPHPRCPIWPGN